MHEAFNMDIDNFIVRVASSAPTQRVSHALCQFQVALHLVGKVYEA